MNSKEQLLERQREHFNSISGRYQKGRQSANHLYLKELMWTEVFSQLPQQMHGKHLDVLEPMCGFCDGYDLIRRHLTTDITYSGFDYSDSVVETVKKANPSINIWQADATKFAPTPESYDLIFLVGGLHHTPLDAQTIVGNLASGLRSGGIFVNYEPTHGNPLIRAVRDRIYQKNSLFDEQTERAFAVTDLETLFRNAGLAPLATWYFGLLSYILYYNPDAFPYLNQGGKLGVKMTFAFDRLFHKNIVGRTLSFATLSAWQKP